MNISSAGTISTQTPIKTTNLQPDKKQTPDKSNTSKSYTVELQSKDSSQQPPTHPNNHPHHHGLFGWFLDLFG
jgi:hypothetical protein